MVREQVNSDDDLTNLNWLQAGNILDMIPCDLTNNEKSRASCNKRITIARDKLTSRSIIVPPVAYDPLIHIRTRPPFSFSCLIFMAIESSPDKVLPVRCIYSWITHHFPFYRYEKLAWKNTVRHKLSRSKCFKRLDRHSRKPFTGTIDDTTDRKSSLWFVDPLARPSLMTAVKRSSAHVYPYMSTVNRSTHTRTVNHLLNFKSITNQSANLPLLRQSTDEKSSDPEETLCNKKHESHDNYDADDEEDTSSREAEAVESMLTLTESINPSTITVSSTTKESFDKNTNQLELDQSSNHNYFTNDQLIGFERMNQSNNGIVELIQIDDDCVQGAQVLINLSRRHPSFSYDNETDQQLIIKCLKKV